MVIIAEQYYRHCNFASLAVVLFRDMVIGLGTGSRSSFSCRFMAHFLMQNANTIALQMAMKYHSECMRRMKEYSIEQAHAVHRREFLFFPELSVFR